MNTFVATGKRPMSAASFAWYAALVLIPVVTAALLFSLRQAQVAHYARRNLGSFGTVPTFSLTNQMGKRFGFDNLTGKIWIADFIYSSCPGPCPMISTRMGELQKPLRDTDVQLVSFSVDPERDTPDVLRTYADKLAADPRRWTFLTGPKAAIYSLTRDGFKLGVSGREEPSQDPVHSTRLVLVDRHGVIRGYYDATEADGVTRLLADTSHLLREQPR